MPDYHLYTIPVWDAYKKQGECAMCELHRMLEAQYLDAALGGGMMESDIRLQTNAQGFCAKHLRDLNGMQSALPLSLMLHTHLRDVIADIEGDILALEAAADREAGLPVAKKALRYIAKGGDMGDAAAALAEKALTRSQGCHICDKIDKNLVRYAEALLHMWVEEKEFKEAFESSKGVCIAHLPLLLQTAERKLAGAKRRDFLRILAKLERENLSRIEKEIEWFTLKFDYRNAKQPWDNSKDAIPRTMQKLRGPVLDE